MKIPDFSITRIIDSGLKSPPERYTRISPIQSPFPWSGGLSGTNSAKNDTIVLGCPPLFAGLAIGSVSGAENGR